LRQRLGWRNNTTQSRRRGPGPDFDATAGWINYNARDYLCTGIVTIREGDSTRRQRHVRTTSQGLLDLVSQSSSALGAA